MAGQQQLPDTPWHVGYTKKDEDDASEFPDTKIRQENENIYTWEKYTYHPERNMMNAALFYRDEWYHALDGTLHCINTHTGKDRFEEESFSKQSGIFQLGNIEGEWLFFGKDLWNKNEDSGIYRFNIMTGENCKLVSLEDIGYIPVMIYTKDSVLYLQGEQADQLQCYSIEKGSGIENNSRLKNNSEMGENVKMRLQRIQNMIPADELNPTALYSLLEYGYAAYPSYQNNVVYVYEDEKQDVTVIDNVKANVSVTHKGVIYTDMDNNIHLLDRAGTDTILYAYESQTGFLNYGNYDEGGIFVCSESDTGIDIYYITWDGMKNLLVHCNGARLGTDLWLSSGNDYYSYFRNGEFVISKKILYSDAY